MVSNPERVDINEISNPLVSNIITMFSPQVLDIRAMSNLLKADITGSIIFLFFVFKNTFGILPRDIYILKNLVDAKRV